MYIRLLKMDCTYYYHSKIGYFKIKIENDVLIELDKVEEKQENENYSKILPELIKQLDEYFEGKRKCFTVPYKTKGTPFQEKVWKELTKIPYGETRSYKDIAIKVGCPKGYRAVGLANNKNKISIVIPCHRVIGTNKKLIGYSGGIKTKEQLLDLEQKCK